MAMSDYYKTLGVGKKASLAEIKRAYRKLARKYHPDLNPGDKQAEKKFKEITDRCNVPMRAKVIKNLNVWFLDCGLPIP